MNDLVSLQDTNTLCAQCFIVYGIYIIIFVKRAHCHLVCVVELRSASVDDAGQTISSLSVPASFITFATYLWHHFPKDVCNFPTDLKIENRPNISAASVSASLLTS